MRFIPTMFGKIAKVLLCMLCVLCVLPCVSVRAQGTIPIDGVVARVNGEAILLSELKEAALDLSVDIDAIHNYNTDDEAFLTAISHLVDQRLLEQEAQREKLAVDQVKVSQEVDLQIQSLQARAGGEEKLKQFLAERYLTLEALREQLRRREARNSLTTAVVVKRVQVESGELSAYESDRKRAGEPTQMWRLAQILFKCSEEQQETKRGEAIEALALRVARELAQDRDAFPDYATRYSDDPATAQAGGYLGWLAPEELQPMLRRGLERTDTGNITKPIRTDKGFHIFYKIEERTVRDLFFADLYEKERVKLLERLRNEATIKIYDLTAERPRAEPKSVIPSTTEETNE